METRQQVFGSAVPQKLLKAKVQVCGRYLLRPEDDFGPDRAEELVRRAVKDGAKVRTGLHLYSSGLRLGDNGIFASMPLEYIKYQRIAACISPRQQHPRMLALCTRDYEQRCVTIVQFKDADALAEASRLIDRQRRLVAEEANYLSDSPRRSSGSNNWALETAPSPSSPTSSAAPQGPPDRRPALFSRDIAVPPQQPQPSVPDRHEARVTVSATATAKAAVVANVRTTAFSLTDDVFDAEPRRRTNDIDTVVLNYDDIGGVAKCAVFESHSGPPTLLNELRVVTSQSNGASAVVSRPAALRVHTEGATQTVRPHEDQVDGGAWRQQVAHVRTSARNFQRTGSLQMQQQQLQQQHPQQQVFELQYSPPQPQLVRLVPVRTGQPPQHHQSRHHHRQQQIALYPASRGSLGRGYYLVSK